MIHKFETNIKDLSSSINVSDEYNQNRILEAREGILKLNELKEAIEGRTVTDKVVTTYQPKYKL